MINSKDLNKNTPLYAIIFGVFLIILSFTNSISAQEKIEIKGLIVDQSNYPVPFVAVGIVKKYLGTASTEDGEFAFFATKNELQDTLSVSSLGYDPFKIKIEDFLNQEKKEIVLIESTTELDAVTLLKSSDYVVNALKTLKDNTLSQPHKLEILYRGAASESGKAKFFVENYIKVRDRGPAFGMGVIEVAQSRKSADYRYWKRKQWRHSIVGVFEVNPLRPIDSQHYRNLKKFKWKKIGDSSYEGEDVVILEGNNPKSKWEKMKLYIGVDTYKVYRIERGSSLYIYKKHKTGKMVLSYTRGEWKFPKDKTPKEYWGTPGETLQYKREGFVLNIETNKKNIKVRPYGEEIDMGSIDLPYHADFWKTLSIPPDTKFYKKIKKELEGNFGVPLEKQYELVNK